MRTAKEEVYQKVINKATTKDTWDARTRMETSAVTGQTSGRFVPSKRANNTSVTRNNII